MSCIEDKHKEHNHKYFDCHCKDIDREYVYMTIPRHYVCVYRKLIVMLSQFGIDLLNDCSATCKGNNKTIINCWHMFLSAIAAHQLGDDKTANLLINYINGQIKLIYGQNSKYLPFVGNVVLPICKHGYVKTIIGCEETAKLRVDVKTGKLSVEYPIGVSRNAFRIEKNNLIHYK